VSERQEGSTYQNSIVKLELNDALGQSRSVLLDQAGDELKDLQLCLAERPHGASGDVHEFGAGASELLVQRRQMRVDRTQDRWQLFDRDLRLLHHVVLVGVFLVLALVEDRYDHGEAVQKKLLWSRYDK